MNAHLVYCVQDEARAHFSDELRTLAERVPGFHSTLHYFYREGPLRREFLEEHCPDFRERQAHICGPNPLMNLAADVLTDAGVSRNRIHSEEFQLL